MNLLKKESYELSVSFDREYVCITYGGHWAKSLSTGGYGMKAPWFGS